MVPNTGPRQVRSSRRPPYPSGLGVQGWGQRPAWPCLLALPGSQQQNTKGAARGAAGAEGLERGPQMPPRPPFLGRGPHGVGEQEESIRIMKPQPATHRGGTEKSGPVPSPPDGSEERSPARPGGGGGRSGGSAEPVRGGRTQLRAGPWQPRLGNRDAREES